METFPIVRRRDQKQYGYYRTKDTILEIYDEMAQIMSINQAISTEGRGPNTKYQTRLDPPPGPPCDESGNLIPIGQCGDGRWGREMGT